MESTSNTTKKQVSRPINYMEMDEFTNKHVTSLIDEANNIGIIPAYAAGTDAYLAGAGLYYMVKEKYQNDQTKKVHFVYQGETPEKCDDIIPAQEIKANLQDRELIISIDYSNTSASKVQYSTDDEILHLKISPVPKDFETERIKAKITGFDFDLVFIIGARELGDIGKTYNNLRQEINTAKKIVLDNSNKNKRFGVVNVVDDKAESLSALVFKYASFWNLTPNTKSAKALLEGISHKEPNKG